ncbi:MAG: ABC transporter, partial [Tolypothrix sp. Co-bin9]|nr:ABC transporter [Tolypothrix sp. Co-bin9]
MSKIMNEQARSRTRQNKDQAVHPLKRLLNYGRKYHLQIWQAIACSILNKIFDLAPPALVGTAVDVVVQKQDSLIARLGVRDVFGQLLILAFLTFIIWSLVSTFEYAYKLLWRNLAQAIEHDLRLDAYTHIQELELAYFEDRSTGGLMSILNDDINQLERFLDSGATEILQVLTTVVIIGSVFFVLAPSVAWMSMLPMPFILWGSMAFQKRLAPYYA